MTDRTHFVYEAYDADGLLLYVGCTGKPGDRYRAHMAGNNGDGRGWFESFVTHWRVSGPYPKRTALDIEKARILRAQPIWNGMSEGNRNSAYALIREYLAFHGVQFVSNPNRCRPDLVPVRSSKSGRRRLRVVA